MTTRLTPDCEDEIRDLVDNYGNPVWVEGTTQALIKRVAVRLVAAISALLAEIDALRRERDEAREALKRFVALDARRPERALGVTEITRLQEKLAP